MKNEKVKEIIIEIERVRVIRHRTSCFETWCHDCAAESQFVTLTEAAILTETGVQKIFQCADVGALHTTTTADGTRLVCLNSLLGTSFI